MKRDQELILDRRHPQRKDFLSSEIRNKILDDAKDFKTSWVNLGQGLLSVWRDKLYYPWGHEKFEDYIEKEVGLQKSLALKLLKTYHFVEEEEPIYLQDDFKEREAIQVPHYEGMNLLRLAKKRKELLNEDYQQIRRDILDKGRDIGAVRKDLTAVIKERKVVDPDEERDKRQKAAIRKLLSALTEFHNDADVLKIIPHQVVEKSKTLKVSLQQQL